MRSTEVKIPWERIAPILKEWRETYQVKTTDQESFIDFKDWLRNESGASVRVLGPSAHESPVVLMHFSTNVDKVNFVLKWL